MRPFPPFLRSALASRGRGLTVLALRLAAMGDILRTLPPVRLLKRALPEARVFWVLDDRWRVVLDGHPDLDGIVTFPRKEWQTWSSGPAGWRRFPASLGDLRSRLRATGAGLSLDFHGNLRSGATAWISGAPVRLGYAGHQQKEINRWFNNYHRDSGSRRTPRMERNLELIRALGLPDHPLPPGDLPLVANGRDPAERIRREVLGARPYAVISPGASVSQSYKKPPSPLVATACRTLVRRGISPLVVWGPGEEPDALRVTSDPLSGGVLAPPTDLPTLAALLDGARLFLGGDSGPLHLACAVGCPVVGIYGPTDPEVNRPWGVPWRVVFPEGRAYTGIKRIDREAGGFEGIREVDVEREVSELLSVTAGRQGVERAP